MRLWIDTDVGDNPDDAAALLLAARHPAVTLAGVSTVGGDVEARAALVRELVGDAVAVVPGGSGLAGAVSAASPEALVAIGPLTNVAALCRGGVDLPPWIVVMGGLLAPIEHRGALRTTETNFGADPAAVRAVIEDTGATVVPVDVTAGMLVTEGQERELAGTHPVIAREIERWVDHRVCLHDPLAVLVAVDDVAATVRTVELAVDVDGRLVEHDGAHPHPVVVDVDHEAAVRRVLSVLATGDTGAGGGGPG